MRQRGDTIIEVMIAVTIFSLVAVGSITIMNHGIAASQRSLEITQVRQQIDAQAEMLRFIHHQYMADPSNMEHAAAWNALLADAGTGASRFVNDEPTCSAIPSAGYALNPANLAMITAYSMDTTNGTPPPYSQVVQGPTVDTTASYGLWIEAVNPARDPLQPTRYADFHIRTCWYTVGQSTPITLGTIVRLYYAAN